MRAASPLIAIAMALLNLAWASRSQAQGTAPEEAAPVAAPALSPEPAVDPPLVSSPTEPAVERPLAEGEPLAAPGAPTDAGPVVLLYAPPALRAEWTAALQVELAPRGVTVVPMDPPEGPTPLIVDAETQRLVLEHNADSAVLVVAGERAHSIRVLTPDAAAARVAPVSVEADPRTAALIAVSLSDEQPLPAAPQPPWYRRGAPAREAAAPPRVVDFEPPSSSPSSPPSPEPGADRLLPSFRVGTGVFGYLNDRRAFVGSLVRVGGGLQYGLFEAELLFDGGLMMDQISGHGTEVQPMVRGCLGAGLVTDDTTQLHLGLRTCGGYAEARTVQRDPMFERGDPFDAGFVFDAGGVLLDLGAYAAASFPVGDGLRLHLRANLGGGFIDAVSDAPRVSATLSTLLAVM